MDTWPAQSFNGVHSRALRYALFGLTVESDFELPQLALAAGGQPDVLIRRTSLPHRAPVGADGTLFEFGKAEQCLAWDSVGTFLVVGTDRIEVDPKPGVADALVALPLLGSVVAALLQRRGIFVLHASAAAIDGAAFALLGDKGAGKSTTIGALIAAGHSLLADDVVAIDFSQGPPAILPAFGQLKLWDEAAVTIGTGLERGDRLHPAIDKSNYRVASFSASPEPLRRLYVLRRGAKAAVRPIEAPEAISALLRFSYMGRFGQAGFGATVGEHFRRCSLMAGRGVVQILEVPDSLHRLGEAIAAIEQDVVAAPDLRF